MQPTSKAAMMWSVALAFLMGTALGGVERATAFEVLDQSQELYDAGFSLEYGPLHQQTFRPVYSNITAISVLMMHPATVSIELFDAACGTFLGSGTGTTTNAYDWLKVDLRVPVLVTPEGEYAFQVTGTPAPSNYCGKQADPYPRGLLYFDCSPMFGEYDLAFRTYSDDALVPATLQTWGDVKHLYR